jgi:glycosyltransferase involved in cell wall biosynthesis
MTQNHSHFKKILIVNCHFPPYAAQGSVMRILKFARYLPEYGWKPFVLSEKKQAVEDNSLLKELPSEVVSIPLDAVTPQKRKSRYKKALSETGSLSLIKRILYFLYRSVIYNLIDIYQHFFQAPDRTRYWARKAFREIISIHQEHEFDAIMTSGPPFSTFWFGLRFRKRFQIPWILDFRDGWAGNPLFQNQKLCIRLQNRWLEKKAVRHCNRVLLVTQPMLEIYRDRYPKWNEKMTLLTNGFDPADFQGIKPVKRKKEHLHFLFSGTISGRRSPIPFFNALQIMFVKNPALKDSVRVTFVGRFNYKLENIPTPLVEILFLEGQLPHRAALEKMAGADVFVLIINTSQGGRTIMSGKIFEYLAFLKPILVISKPCAATDLVRELGAGYLADDVDENEIHKQIQRIVQDWKKDQLQVGFPPEALKRFHRRRLTKTLGGILDEMTGADS